tara:strand:- start:79 stop:288 length:210 start_codon:yes stop_codon:yes gene_type:complete
MDDNKAKLIKQLREIERITGKIPRTIDLQNMKGYSSYRTFLKVFGSWEKTLLEAGYNCKERNFGWNKKK